MKVAVQEKGTLKLTVCSPVKASKIIGVSPDTIRRHKKNNRHSYMTKDYFIILNVEMI